MPDPLVVTTMNAFKADLLRQETTQMAAMARRWRQTEAALIDQVELFARRVADDKLSRAQLQDAQYMLGRSQSLLRQARAEFDKYVRYAGPLIETRQRQLGAQGIQHAEAAINAVGTEAGVEIGFNRLPTQAVENMVGLAGDNSPLTTLLESKYGDGVDGMFTELIRATALGKNPRETAQRMVREGFSQSLTQMMVIARTEQLRVYREAARQAYQESGVVEAFRRLATRDNRVCAACMMADGEYYELNEMLRSHVQCRCTTVPSVEGFPEVQWQKGPDWFMEQSSETQTKILGKGRYAAWKDGLFDLDQLMTLRTNAQWGDSVQPTSLKALLNGTAQRYNVQRELPNPFGNNTFTPPPWVTGVTNTGVIPVIPPALPPATPLAPVPALVPPGVVPVPTPAIAPTGFAYLPSGDQLERVHRNVDREIDRIARMRGVQPAQVQNAVDAVVKDLARFDIGVQFPAQHLDSLLGDGRLKSQFETGQSSALTDTKLRSTTEAQGLGAPLTLDPKLRPIYGYLRLPTPRQDEAMRQYGELTFIMKPEIRERTTLTAGNSLGPFQNARAAGSPLNDPKREAWGPLIGPLYNYSQSKDLGELVNQMRYMEVQMHGGINLKDVSRVIDPSGKITPEQIERLRMQGIEVEKGEPTEESPRAAASKKPVKDGDSPVSVSSVKPSKKGTFDPNNPADVRRRLDEVNKEYTAQIAAATEAADKLFMDFIQMDSAIHKTKRIAETQAGTPEGVAAAVALERQKAEFAQASKRMNEAQAERDRLKVESRNKVASLVNVSNPSSVKMNATGQDPADVKRWQAGLDIFNNLVSADIYAPGGPKFERFDEREHYSNSTKTVYVGANTKPSVVAHEVGHWLEYTSPAMRKKVEAFFTRRTVGESTRQLTGKPEGETGKEDNFLNTYMGREYFNDNGTRRSSEIVSMGIQYLYEDPLLLARRDPDYFDFMFLLLRGKSTY